MDNNPFAQPPSAPPPPSVGSGKATASLVLGILGMFFWLIPLFGLPITITGLVLANKARQVSTSGISLAGKILCTIGLSLAALNAVVGAFMAIYRIKAS